MKLKHFTAPSSTLALSQIHEELGEDAIIISTETLPDGVRVTAAVEEAQNINFDSHEQLEVSPSLQVYDDVVLRESLEYHDVLPEVSGQILALARQYNVRYKTEDNQKLLAFALQQMYRFKPISGTENQNKVFIGQPGCGKSTAIVKLATQAKMQGKKACIISTDNVRAGANEQLEAFAKILEMEFYFCKTARELFYCVQSGQNRYDMLLIDTPGINPYKDREIERIDEFFDSLKADKFLVMDAGRNTLEAVETAEIFCRLGCEWIVPTHLDMTRRIGSVLSSAYCNHLNFCAASVSSNIAKGLADVTPPALAGLLLTQEEK